MSMRNRGKRFQVDVFSTGTWDRVFQKAYLDSYSLDGDAISMRDKDGLSVYKMCGGEFLMILEFDDNGQQVFGE